MKTMINNFVDDSPVEVCGSVYENSGLGPLVTLSQHVGSVSLCHSMRPEQAREMAAALIACADELDAPAVAQEVTA